MSVFWNGIYLSPQKAVFVLIVIVHLISQNTNSLKQKQIIKHSRIEIYAEFLQGIWGKDKQQQKKRRLVTWGDLLDIKDCPSPFVSLTMEC